MSGYFRLWESIKNHVCDIHGVQRAYAVNSEKIQLTTLRTAQIFTLDVLLHEHRKKFGSGIFPLRGKDALHHKILIKYKWPLETIRNLSLSDCLLAIQDELTPENLPADAREFLSQQDVKIHDHPDELSDGEWNQDLGELFLSKPPR